MENIRFLQDQQIYEGKVSLYNHVAVIRFQAPLPPRELLTRGFELLNENNGLVQADYSAYTTLYRPFTEEEALVELSDDGSVYVPPVVTLPQEPEPYVPSYEEVLAAKINELSAHCQGNIEAGLDIDGLHYSYTQTDQINLNDIVHISGQTGLPLGYHADGQSCAPYTAAQLRSLYTRLAMHKYCQQAYFNQARAYLRSLEATEENKTLVETFLYGTPLTGSYLETYEDITALYEQQLAAMAATTEEE